MTMEQTLSTVNNLPPDYQESGERHSAIHINHQVRKHQLRFGDHFDRNLRLNAFVNANGDFVAAELLYRIGQ
jgi:hypothetical protein